MVPKPLGGCFLACGEEGSPSLDWLLGSHRPRFKSQLHLVYWLRNPVTGEILVGDRLSIHNLGRSACLQPQVLWGQYTKVWGCENRWGTLC